jgi:hypothetical protein
VLGDFAVSEPAHVFFGLDSTPWCEGELGGTEHLEATLERLQSWPRWNGSECGGQALAPMLASGGWHLDPATGHWTCRQQGTIRFRVPLSRHAQRSPDLQLYLRGPHRGQAERCRLTINGEPKGEHRLNEAVIRVAASELGREREMVVILYHAKNGNSTTPLLHLASLELRRV